MCVPMAALPTLFPSASEHLMVHSHYWAHSHPSCSGSPLWQDFLKAGQGPLSPAAHAGKCALMHPWPQQCQRVQAHSSAASLLASAPRAPASVLAVPRYDLPPGPGQHRFYQVQVKVRVFLKPFSVLEVKGHTFTPPPLGGKEKFIALQPLFPDTAARFPTDVYNSFRSSRWEKREGSQNWVWLPLCKSHVVLMWEYLSSTVFLILLRASTKWR